MSPVVVLVGPPGAGKTTVGELLARRWSLGFRDTDSDVERAAGMTAAEVFVEYGEPRFRELERAAVLAALDEHGGVLAVGGGSVLDPAVRDGLRGHTVVFLDVGIADAARRIGLNRNRPVALGNPRAQWGRLMEARRPVYEALASAIVDTDGKRPDAVAADVSAAIERRRPTGE